MTQSALPTLTHAEQIFKDLIWEPLLLAGETALFTWESPVLAVPIVGGVLTAVEKEAISLASEWMFRQFVLLIDITAIKWVNQEHQAAYDRASEKLLVIATDSGIDSVEFKKARDDAKAALAQFIRPVIG